LVRRRAHADLNSDNPCRLNEIVAKLRVTGQWALNKHRTFYYSTTYCFHYDSHEVRRKAKM